MYLRNGIHIYMHSRYIQHISLLNILKIFWIGLQYHPCHLGTLCLVQFGPIVGGWSKVGQLGEKSVPIVCPVPPSKLSTLPRNSFSRTSISFFGANFLSLILFTHFQRQQKYSFVWEKTISRLQISSKYPPNVLQIPSKCPLNILQMSSKFSPNILQMSSKYSPNVLQISSKCPPNILQMSSKYYPNVLQMSSKCPSNVHQMSCKCPQNVFKMSSNESKCMICSKFVFYIIQIINDLKHC